MGPIARKDYFNFKNFYSIITLAMVDGSGRFLWGASGMPGNCHDSTYLRGSSLWEMMQPLCEQATTTVSGVEVPGLILGDNAFPFRTYLMKRFSNANLTGDQRAFNKFLSKDRVIVENAFGYLKMRFRELYRGCESAPENTKYSCLAAMALHNILFEREGLPRAGLDDTPGDQAVVMLQRRYDPQTHQQASRVRDAIMPLVLGR